MPTEKHKFQFQGKFSELLWLIVKNTIFTILTLGIYIPYARTNMRKYLWKSTKLEGYSFLFHADPKKLLRGYLLLGGALALSMMCVTLSKTYVPTLAPLIGLIPFMLVFAFSLRARFGAYAYLLNNTSYRSVRFNVKKEAVWDYMGRSLKDTFLILFTLGLYLPCSLANLTRIKWQATSYGNVAFKFDMSNWDYAVHCYKGIFLCLITLGFYTPWFIVSVHKYKMSHLTFNGIKLESTVTGGGLILLSLKSSLFLIFSLGLATPYIMNMNIAFFIDNLSLNGPLNFDQIIQVQRDNTDQSFSESVADVLNVDVDVA